MKNKILMVTGIVVTVMFLIFCVWFLFVDKNIYIELNGDNIKNIDVFTEYEEEGAKAYYKPRLLGGKKIETLTIEGNVDINKIGKYSIYYKADYNGKKKKVERIVNVFDNEPPNIEVDDTYYACPNNNTSDVLINYKVIDNYDGDITDNVIKNYDNDIIYLTVRDSSNNETTKSVNIEFKDIGNPIIDLVGNNEIYILKGQAYKEPGYKAIDNCDGDITNKVVVENNININKNGTYEVKYSVTDSSGNTYEKKRIVKVYTKSTAIVPSGTTIYLTFDDGPGPYTKKLLDILKKYDVKVTFFVTAQSWDASIVKRAYNEGHAIGLHTYSHSYSKVYASVDAYFDDLNKIDNLVYDAIRIHSKLVRFPGGSSNTVSKITPGIMTTLASMLEEKGYKYFDWNVGSSDTSNISSEKIANNIINSLSGRNAYIVLQHDIKSRSVDAVEKVIKYGLEHGYEFKALDETSPTAHHRIAN